MLDRYKFLETKNHVKMSNNSIEQRDIFIKKYGSKENLDFQNCFICEKNDYLDLSEIDRYGFFYPTGICKNCGSLQQKYYYNRLTLETFYKYYYRSIYSGFSPETLFNQQIIRGNRVFSFCNKFLKPNGSILDIGTGSGGALKIFYEKGYQVTGLDFDKEYIQKGLEKNSEFNLICGGLEDLKPNTKFDLIILNHVLEHTINPKEFLEKISKYLNLDGLIFIEVPSLNNVEKGDGYHYDLLNYYQNAHSIHFHENSFRYLVENSGYEIIRFNQIIQAVLKKTSSSKKNLDYLNFDYGIDLIRRIENKRLSKGLLGSKLRKFFWFYKTEYFLPFWTSIRNVIVKVLRKFIKS